MELLDEVIEENLGVHIDGNVEVDFDGFMESLSVLGNLDIELNATEAKYLNAHSDLSETDENGLTLKAVSYTRLDVYKRQLKACSEPWMAEHIYKKLNEKLSLENPDTGRNR